MAKNLQGLSNCVAIGYSLYNFYYGLYLDKSTYKIFTFYTNIVLDDGTLHDEYRN